MNFGRKRRGVWGDTENAFIPLIDVFLNILIFFLVSTSFSAAALFDIQVPQTKTGAKGGAEAEALQISIDKTGQLYWQKQRVSQSELVASLTAIPTLKRRETQVTLQADKATLHGLVVTVLDTLRDLGFNQVSLVTEELQ